MPKSTTLDHYELCFKTHASFGASMKIWATSSAMKM